MKNKYLFLAFFIPDVALADGGITVFVAGSIYQIIVLLGVVFVEYRYLSKRLTYLRKKELLCDTAIANVASTLLGFFSVPISIICLTCHFGAIACYYLSKKISGFFSNVTVTHIVSVVVQFLCSIAILLLIILALALFLPLTWSLPQKPYDITYQTIVMLISCFIESCFVETFIFNCLPNKVYSRKELSQAILRANLQSYFIFFIILLPVIVLFFI